MATKDLTFTTISPTEKRKREKLRKLNSVNRIGNHGKIYSKSVIEAQLRGDVRDPLKGEI